MRNQSDTLEKLVEPEMELHLLPIRLDLELVEELDELLCTEFRFKVERFVTSAIRRAGEKDAYVESVIQSRLSELSDLVGGYDFAEVIEAYWQGYESGNDQLGTSAIHWLRAEYSTKTDAREALDFGMTIAARRRVC